MQPLEILNEARKAVPAVKFAIGVAGVAAAVAIITGIVKDFRVAIFGTIIMFGLMFILLVFSSIARKTSSVPIQVLAYTLAAFFVLLIMGTSLMLFTSVFFSYPRPLDQLFRSPLVVVPTSSPTPAPIISSQNAELLLKKKIDTWIDRVFGSQAENGGIRSEALNPLSIPQVWTTAQCLKGVLSTPANLGDHVDQTKSAFGYIENARRTQPEEGWGLYEEREKTATEIAGWVAIAYIASVDSRTNIWSSTELPEVLNRIQRDLDHIVQRQDSNGGWRPIREEPPPGFQSYTRTYSTVMALWSLIEARRTPIIVERIGKGYDARIRRGIVWLLRNYDTNLGWTPNPNRSGQSESFDGLTAQVLFVLSRAERDFRFIESEHIHVNAEKNFAKNRELAKRSVLFNNRTHDYDLAFRPTTYQLEGSTFLWFPWSLLVLTHLQTDSSLSQNEQQAAAQQRQDILVSNADQLIGFVEREPMYVLGETLFCLSNSIK